MISKLVVMAALALCQEAPKREAAEVTYGDGRKVKLTIVRPKGYDARKKHPVVLALPPGPGTAEMVTFNLDTYWEKEAFARGFLVVSPEIVGPDLETEAKLLVPAVFAWMDKNLSYDASRVALTGASNGGLGVFHAALADPSRFAALIALPGGYQGAADLAPLKGKPAWLLVGERDKMWVSLAEATHRGLKAAGANATLEIVKGQDHVLTLEPKKLYDWIDASLKPKK